MSNLIRGKYAVGGNYNSTHDKVNMKKILSIIIPHYNSACYLERLLKSIPRNEEIQVIVVDDNSTERDVEDVIKKYDYVEFYCNQEKVNSAGACRNVGLQHAMGKWILFADADDYFVDDFLTKLRPHFNSDADIVFFKPTSIYNEDGRIAERHVIYEKIIQQYIEELCEKNELLLRYEYVSPCSKLIRKDLIDKNEIQFEKIRYSNDVMFSTFIALRAKRIEASLDVIYVITKMNGTLTTTVTENSFKQRLDVFIRRNNLLKKELTDYQFKMLNINGVGHVYNILKYRLGIKVLVSCVKNLKENDIPVMNPEFFRLSFWMDKLKEKYKVGKK